MNNDRQLLIATMNQGKVGELSLLLRDLPWHLRGLAEFQGMNEVAETADTFAGNAELKARGYAAQTGLWTLADDSGLEVDALHGAPGVYSARYGGEGLNANQRLLLLLDALRDVPETQRAARFVCAIAVARADSKIVFRTAGYCRGTIALQPRGSGGFGYDPIFTPTGFNQTFGELPAGLKNTLSHRAQALVQTREFLAQLPDLTA